MGMPLLVAVREHLSALAFKIEEMRTGVESARTKDEDKQKLAEIRDRYPDVIAEVRGEGLLVGLRAVVPSAQLVDALRAEKMITVAAGDNVVRLLPPLIVSEDEVAEAVRRIDRACAGIGKALQEPQRQGAAG